MADYYPRLTDAGMEGNRLWYSDNPYYTSGNGLPNCTCYAWGRAWENGGGTPEHRPTLSLSNAENWYGHNDGYERGSAPALGAILCLADGPYSGLGHVAVVEEIHTDGSITCSNSAWAEDPASRIYFYLSTLYPSNNYEPHPAYRFQGFIYYPYGGGQPIPIGGRKKLWYFKRKLWRIEKELFD